MRSRTKMPPVCSVSCHLLHLFSQPILAATLGNAKSRHCKQARKPTGQNHLYVPSTQHTAWPQSCCCCVLAQSCLILCDPMACSPPGSSVHEIFQARILEWVAISFFRGSSGDLPQGIFLTQESNLGLLHCRQILYQLSYRGS